MGSPSHWYDFSPEQRATIEQIAQAVAPGGSGIPFGDDTGVSATIANSVKGSGDAQAAEFTGHTTAFAIKKASDAHPWFVIASDSDGVYIGDGSYDPFSGGGINIYPGGDGHGLHINGSGPFNITGGGDCAISAGNELDLGGTHSTRVAAGPHGDALAMADAGSSLELTGTTDLTFLLNLKLNDQTPVFAVNSHGAITTALLQSEDASLHQLQVADDGTLSTIPFP